VVRLLPFWDRSVDALPEYETFALDLYSLGAGPGWEEFVSPPSLSLDRRLLQTNPKLAKSSSRVRALRHRRKPRYLSDLS